MGFEKVIARCEAFIKGMTFDCHACGQCVLRQTGLICPMTCPKGLRNGPCGGSLDGRCDVYPDKACVWVRIHHRTDPGSMRLPDLLPSPDASLLNTSSYLNYLRGTDRYSRTPLAYLDLGSERNKQPPWTGSLLERRLKSGAFVKTCEVRSPRSIDLEFLSRQALLVRDHFDAVNATAYLSAKPSLPSPVAAAKLAELGIDAISQATCRDHTKTSFIAELFQNQLNAVHNILCLTGDSYNALPRIKQVFDMDGALMLYEARYLRHTGIIHFTGDAVNPPPKLFLGAAINPFTTPIHVPIRRLKQKVAAGADFIQTQLVLDVEGFKAFMALARGEGIDRDVFILAGVPVITSARALEALRRIAGVRVPPEIVARLQAASDIEAEGVALARQIIQQIRRLPGVHGVHLMLFGHDHAVLPHVVSGLDSGLPPSAQSGPAANPLSDRAPL